MAEFIPVGSLLHRMPNGDVPITLPHAHVPWLCVEHKQFVRPAISRQTVDQALAEAAKRYVQNFLP